MQITLDKDVIDNIDLSPLNQYIEWNQQNSKFFNLEAGKEHYKLLAYLSKELKCQKLIDIGHYFGFSSVALSFDERKEVSSYDIYNWLPDDGTLTSENKGNINFYIGDYIDDIPKMIKGCDLVMIDIDNTGFTEREIMEALRKANYKGLVLLDDIHLNPEMKEFFQEIPEHKLDITKVGHWSGTGLVVFDKEKFNITLK